MRICDVPTRALFDNAQRLRDTIEWRQAGLVKYVPGPNRAALAEQLSRKAAELESIEREIVRRGKRIMAEMKYTTF